ncbi:putative MFS transporter, AGZA family, xanthine/uracil permease [Enhydrobacter aerosaccus]|uniref:Putative MFS transporter, AGZA family, xanthine/uracil permease n=1 Tax=Enhydrobacter aerosaccus TaxID=225324 RepID=A0A1T4KXP0_9HYPH|nr:NCS2 family permease [Enhydrobacter aerosaccus]SJZ47186.1 putative MFS transporter, AGZA family, xanthine/uracil permease [Enhydrobacter aerosaccus]
MLERLFKLREHDTTAQTEIVAGITTFLTMAYIIFVNPQILGMAKMPVGAVFVSTCVAAAVGCFLMAFLANYPIALAPGMGLNAYFAFGVVGGMGYSWQVALGCVFISGILFFIISVLPVREWIVNAIPKSLKMSIAAGIGLFLALIAFKNAGVVTADQATLVTHGKLKSWPVLMAMLGFALIVALEYRRIMGGVIIGILAVTAISIIAGEQKFEGVFDIPPSIAPVFLQMDLAGALKVGLVTVVFAFLFVDLFDNTGTLIALAHRGGFMRPDGTVPGLKRALMSDSAAAMLGAAIGTSTTTSYIESASGINAGGRTGLTAATVGVLFLLALFIAPLAGSIPGYATAPALLYVACLMARGLTEVEWDDVTEAAPAVITAIAMPFTFSIADGIAFGFISYAGIKLAAGRIRDLHPAVAILAVLFVIKYLVIG